MKELVDFLNARYDEREKKTRGAMHRGRGVWTEVDPLRQTGRIEDDQGEIVVYDEGRPGEYQAAHIADNDPDFVLRDIESKRRIVERYERACDNASAHPEDLASSGAMLALLGACKDLALPFVDHPECKPEWKP